MADTRSRPLCTIQGKVLVVTSSAHELELKDGKKYTTGYVSAISFYELDSKMRLNELNLEPQELRGAVTASGLQTFAITDLHAELAAAFDWDHRDPWDRILATHARLEHCTFLSTDMVLDTVLHERVW